MTSKDTETRVAVAVTEAIRRQQARILSARAQHPLCGVLSFELAHQDGRIYYRLLTNGKGGGSLTDRHHAAATVDYWRDRGWLDEEPAPLPAPAWMAEASDAARADLAALAARYPEKFTYQDGVLRPRRNK